MTRLATVCGVCMDTIRNNKYMKTNAKKEALNKVCIMLSEYVDDPVVKMIRDTIEEYMLTGQYRVRRGNYKKA